MSLFITEAATKVESYVSRLASYGNAYAMARAQGQSPWEASSSCSSFERGLTPQALQPIRNIVDKMIEEREAEK